LEFTEWRLTALFYIVEPYELVLDVELKGNDFFIVKHVEDILLGFEVVFVDVSFVPEQFRPEYDALAPPRPSDLLEKSYKDNYGLPLRCPPPYWVH